MVNRDPNTDITRPTPNPSGDSSLPMPYTGTFLPSLIWSDDRDEVMREKKRLERVRDRLLAALRQADQIEYAIWYMMTLEALYQLDNEIDRLWNWLDSTAPRKRPRQRKIPEILRQ